MPRHWRKIRPSNPGPKKHRQNVEATVRRHGGTLVFCGRERGDRGRWWALVKVNDVADPDAMWRELGGSGPIVDLEGDEELPDRD